MLTWLENWLQGIIAVVLLAVIVELLLPNSKLTRYTRLVVGLILLLTILSPIMRLFEKDFISSLDASYILWDERLQQNTMQTPTLEQIRFKADQLQKSRELQAAKLTAATIEAAILEDLQKNGQDVKRVQVELFYDEQDSEHAYPIINTVTVFIEPPPASETALPEADALVRVEIKAIEEVEDVHIAVSSSTEKDTTTDKEQESEIQASLQMNNAPILNVLMNNWGLTHEQIKIAAIN